jgi:hypothetical protein
MKLTYRGVSYDYNPPEVVYGPTIASGHYRGHPTELRMSKAKNVKQPILDLKYRHVAYTKQPDQVTSPSLNTAPTGMEGAPPPDVASTTEPAMPASEPAAPVDAFATSPQVQDIPPVSAQNGQRLSIQDRARSLMMQHHTQVTRREEDMLSRLYAEIGHPTDVAAHHAARIQGKIYSSFWTSYDRSHASMS